MFFQLLSTYYVPLFLQKTAFIWPMEVDAARALFC
jgi:hypothetical protein